MTNFFVRLPVVFTGVSECSMSLSAVDIVGGYDIWVQANENEREDGSSDELVDQRLSQFNKTRVVHD